MGMLLLLSIGVLLQLGRTRLATLTCLGELILIGVLRMSGQQLETCIVLVTWLGRTLCTDIITPVSNCLVGWYVTDAPHTGMPCLVRTRCMGTFVLTSGNLNAKSYLTRNAIRLLRSVYMLATLGSALINLLPLYIWQSGTLAWTLELVVTDGAGDFGLSMLRTGYGPGPCRVNRRKLQVHLCGRVTTPVRVHFPETL